MELDELKSMDIQIRSYENKDKKGLLNLLSLNIPTYFHPAELEDLTNYLDKEIEDYFVLEVNSNLLASGGINYDEDGHTAKISWDIVHPEYHKQGLGSRLLIHRLACIRSNPSIKNITVRTSQFADKFYGKHGFKEFDRQKNYWAEGYDLVSMEFQPII